ncbi:MAG: hypothetical protein OEZ38_13205, partial [Gammaproteobacteria bacterium]|nr:hypothetical protein [Gammaproteobacteria bacterium]
MKKIISTALHLSIFLTCSQSFATDYYVDNELGNNSNSGLVGFPWENMRKVNNFNFAPGDTIHLRRGQIWQGENINMTESGTEALPITITNYGDQALPKPVLSGAAPFDKEFTGTWDFDIYTANPSSSTDDFIGWLESAISPNLIKADSGYLNKGISAKLQDNGSGSPRIWTNTTMALAADMPIALNLRFKVESGNLIFKVKNLATGNYYSQGSTWGANSAAAVFSSSTYGNWSEVRLELPNDTSMGQILVEFTADGTSYVDSVALTLSWTEHSPGIYKRAILAGLVNGVYDIFHNNLQTQKKTDPSLLTQDFDWTIDATSRVLYMKYSGSLTELNNEPLLANRDAFYHIYLGGSNLTVDGVHIEKAITGIRIANDGAIIKNSFLQDIGGDCSILAVKISGSVAVQINKATAIDNEIIDSGCGIYFRRVDNGFVSGNIINNIRDRGHGGDVEIMGLESVTNSIIENNI